MDRPPASLRVYSLAKRLPGMFAGTDVLDVDHQLFVELELYAAEEDRAQAQRDARERARQRRRSG